MTTVLLVIYLLAAAGLIGLVLIQQGKGADMGASFGAGASNTVFGATGSGNFLTKMTTFFAVIFFVVALVFGNLATHQTESQWVDPTKGMVTQEATDVQSEAPVVEEKTSDEIPQ
ncbi:preprotein translocase subunit SecG [Vibrio sp. HA2012]|uniref:preprotein translocase subunit SecG n=1 Tax=Vibrio sp. HA2012 TaxID=1971595 RepID=UPI000C2BCF54|nr:preprotein translocase subunit SecG [Vibrio sp. HA2012]PJC86151.1 preprotein translocase subunit SecG [Vibrio sp. HA2012]